MKFLQVHWSKGRMAPASGATEPERADAAVLAELVRDKDISTYLAVRLLPIVDAFLPADALLPAICVCFVEAQESNKGWRRNKIVNL